jgi:hypothetical protein
MHRAFHSTQRLNFEMHCQILRLYIEVAMFMCCCTRVEVDDLDAFKKGNAKAVPFQHLGSPKRTRTSQQHFAYHFYHELDLYLAENSIDTSKMRIGDVHLDMSEIVWLLINTAAALVARTSALMLTATSCREDSSTPSTFHG